MSLIHVLITTMLAGAVPSSDSGQWHAAGDSVCPAPRPAQLGRLRQFFARPESERFRERHGLLAIRPGEVRALAGEQDEAACARMREAVRIEQTERYPKVWRGYQAGDFYFMVVSTDVPPGVLYYGSGGLIVLDRNMAIVAASSF